MNRYRPRETKPKRSLNVKNCQNRTLQNARSKSHQDFLRTVRLYGTVLWAPEKIRLDLERPNEQIYTTNDYDQSKPTSQNLSKPNITKREIKIVSSFSENSKTVRNSFVGPGQDTVGPWKIREFKNASRLISIQWLTRPLQEICSNSLFRVFVSVELSFNELSHGPGGEVLWAPEKIRLDFERPNEQI